MSPELLSAIQERIQIGHTKIEIQKELEAAGYNPDMTEEIYVAASQMETVPAAHAPGSLIGCSQLVQSAWSLLKDRWTLFLKSFGIFLGLFIFFGLCILGAAYALVGLDGEFTESVSILVGASVGILLAATAFLLSARVVSFSVIRNLIKTSTGETFAQSLQWSIGNIVPVVAVGLFTYFAVQAGYLFFLIPGIAAAVYLYFSSYVFAKEGVSGIDALVRSAEIVHGRWWGVVGRLLCLFLVFFAVGFVFVLFASFMAEVLNPDLDESSWMLAPVILLGVGLIVVMSAFFQCAIFVLFTSLYSSTSLPTFTAEGRKRLRFWIKVMVIVGPFAAVILQSSNVLSEIENMNSADISGGSDIAVQQELYDVFYRAENYFTNGGNFSYEGVCAEIKDGITVGIVEVCNESPDAWAVRVNNGDETWCADSTEYRKQSSVELGDSTECLVLPDSVQLQEILSEPSTF